MTDAERCARSIGWLEGFAAYLWASAGEKLAAETVALYEEHVERLRKALTATTEDDWEDCK